MTTRPSNDAVSRRATLAAMAGGGLALALSTANQAATARSAPVDHTGHPLTGMWLAMVPPSSPDDPPFPAPSWFGADGLVVLSFPMSFAGQGGVEFQSAWLGTWEPHDETTGHFTAVQTLSSIDGAFLGSVTTDGYPRVSDDGQAFIDDGSLVTVTIRDAAGAVITVVPPGTPGPPITAVRMAPGVAGFPDDAPDAGTPIR